MIYWPESQIKECDMNILLTLPEIFKSGIVGKRAQESISLYKCLEAFLRRATGTRRHAVGGFVSQTHTMLYNWSSFGGVIREAGKGKRDQMGHDFLEVQSCMSTGKRFGNEILVLYPVLLVQILLPDNVIVRMFYLVLHNEINIYYVGLEFSKESIDGGLILPKEDMIIPDSLTATQDHTRHYFREKLGTFNYLHGSRTSAFNTR
ncbi:hypothetical protein MLD38_040397 [Melastoma candidum]|uniref:Uncharacterized protein n=1 Tax=Melastoma candidum TaxID=119954 RepID=A0ACB9L6L5_9MYRT|nr:hypothetical protein MLD38_040397 [Melastoma candidum]